MNDYISDMFAEDYPLADSLILEGSLSSSESTRDICEVQIFKLDQNPSGVWALYPEVVPQSVTNRSGEVFESNQLLTEMTPPDCTY